MSQPSSSSSSCSSFFSSQRAGVCVFNCVVLADACPPTNKQQALTTHVTAGAAAAFWLDFSGLHYLHIVSTRAHPAARHRFITNADLRSDARQSQDNAQSERRCNHRRPAICAGAVVECTFRLAEAFWAHWSEQKPICQAR